MMRMINDIVYTIGYSGFQLEEFLKTLKTHHISAVIDVRSSPHSRYYSEYNAEPLKVILNKNEIAYRSYSREFGARQADSIFSPKGYMDFNLFVKSSQFLEGVRKIERGIEEGYTPAFMCAEKRPVNCHRAILVTRWFFEHGYQVIHILPDGKTETQEDIENQLKEIYFPGRAQISLFNSDKNESDFVFDAYIKANEKIGYRETTEKMTEQDDKESMVYEAI